MRIETWNADEMDKRISSWSGEKADPMPISTLRMQSQIKNPRLEHDDVLMVVMYDGDEMAGYLGLIPDLIRGINGPIKCAWMSCIWVNPNIRGRGVAKQLIAKAFECYDDHILATEFTAPARKLYERIGKFQTLGTLPGLRIYARLDSALILPPKYPKLKKIRGLLKFIDRMSDVFVLPFQFIGRNTSLDEYEVVRSSEINPDLTDFVSDNLNGTFFPDTNRLEWILNNTWMDGSELSKNEKDQYYFSVYDPAAKHELLVIKKDDKIVGLFMLFFRGSQLKVPYLIHDSIPEPILTKILTGEIRRSGARTITVYGEWVHVFQKKRQGFLHTKTLGREYLISTVLAKKIKSQPPHIHAGDGDCAFT